MNAVLWRCPAPSSSFEGIQVLIRPRRDIVLGFRFEDENGTMLFGELIFNGVVHYRATYLSALTVDQIQSAYDQLINCTEQNDYRTIFDALKANGDRADYKHLRICFDDGPCYDFVCLSFEYLQRPI